MTYTPNVQLTYFGRIPTLTHLCGIYKEDKKTHAWAIKLNVSDLQKQQLVQQATNDGVIDGLPTFNGKLTTFGDRFKRFRQSLLKSRVAHGWDAELVRPYPTASTGIIVPRQLRVTPQKVAFPGTEKKLWTRVIAMFETSLNADGTLSDPTNIGEVNCYELGNSFLLFRKAEPVATHEAGAPPNPGGDPNKKRILVINAHGEEPTEKKNGEVRTKTMPIPDNVAFSYGVPSGCVSKCESERGESQIGVLAKTRPTFASIEKRTNGSDVALFPQSGKLHQLRNWNTDLQKTACDAKDLMRLAAGTPRHGRAANTSLTKYHGVQYGDPSQTVPPIVDTRGGDTYDQVAFAALNNDQVDIVTLREGLLGARKSDLIKALDKLGVLSQYDEIYDPSCRTPKPDQSDRPPEWRAVTENRPHPNKPVPLALTGTKAADGTRDAVEI